MVTWSWKCVNSAIFTEDGCCNEEESPPTTAAIPATLAGDGEGEGDDGPTVPNVIDSLMNEARRSYRLCCWLPLLLLLLLPTSSFCDFSKKKRVRY